MAPAPPLASQVAVTGSLLMGVAEHRVDVGYGVERSSGALLGGTASLLVFHRLELAVRAEGGTVGATSYGAVDRDVAQVDVRLRGRATPWLIFEAGYARRMYSTVLARQAWTMLGAGVEGRVALLEGAIHGVARAELLPAVSVSGLPGPTGAADGAHPAFRRSVATALKICSGDERRGLEGERGRLHDRLAVTEPHGAAVATVAVLEGAALAVALEREMLPASWTERRAGVRHEEGSGRGAAHLWRKVMRPRVRS